jgi:hypothetical protein
MMNKAALERLSNSVSIKTACFFWGVYRIWMPGQYTPGCIFTRSIGDKLAEALGVMPDPEILEWELSDQDAFFVLASDGVWEFLSSIQVSIYGNN